LPALRAARKKSYINIDLGQKHPEAA